MCCIFTCCGWMIDLVQRVWTFAMSCCISSAICCVLVSSSLSGIALGYNYSLAEYIDLKETNVSVYLKRGVFDDEIADDLEWRRSGRLPVPGHIKDDNLITGGPDEELPLRSGRRLDDSVFDSGDHNKFEGSLMKLTAKPLDAPITPVQYTPDREMMEIHTSYRPGSMEKMKAIQDILNKRRYGGTSTVLPNDMRRMNEAPIQDTSEGPTPARTPDVWPEIFSGRRQFNPRDPRVYSIADDILNPARTAVPPQNIGSAGNWKIPFLYSSTMPRAHGFDNQLNPRIIVTYPGPITLDWGPIRPPTTKPSRPLTTNTPDSVKVYTLNKMTEVDEAKKAEEFDRLAQKFAEQDQEMSRQNIEDNKMRAENEDYDVDPKGVPSRKKRRTVSDKSIPTMPSELRQFAGAFNTDRKSFPNRYKRDIDSRSSSVPSFLYKLSKSSDKDVEANEILSSRKKRQIDTGNSTFSSTLGKLGRSSDIFHTERVTKVYEIDTYAKSSTHSSTLGELSESSDVLRGERVSKKVPSRKKRHIIFSSRALSSTFDELSKSSDLSLTESVSKEYENDITIKDIPSRKKRHIVAKFSTHSSTFVELSKSSDVFGTKTVPKEYSSTINAKDIKKRHIISSLGTLSSIIGKLSKSSDVFRTETVPKEYEINTNDKDTSSRSWRTVLAKSSHSSLLGELSKSSDVFRTKIVPEEYESDININDIPSRQKGHIIGSSKTLSSTFDSPRKSSDVFHTDIVHNIDFAVNIMSKKKKEEISSGLTTFSTVSKSSNKLHTGIVHENYLNSNDVPSKKKEKIVAKYRFSFTTFDKLNRSDVVANINVNDVHTKIIPNRTKVLSGIMISSDVFDTENIKVNKVLDIKDIPRKIKSSTTERERELLSKESSISQNSQIFSSSTIKPTIFRKSSEFFDMFQNEIKKKEESNIDNKKSSIKHNNRKVSGSITNPTTLNKLNKLSHIMFHTETERKIEGSIRQNSQTVTTLGKFNKSYLDKNNVDINGEIVKVRKKRRIHSSFIQTTPSKLTSNAISSEKMHKIHKTMLVDKLLSTFIGIN